MVVDHTSPYDDNLKFKLHELVAHGKMSSIEMISEQVGADEETTRDVLQELVEEGSISGVLSEDGTRFYSTDLRRTTAPIVPHDEYVLKNDVHDSKQGKIIAVTGIILLILGAIVRGLRTIDFRFDNVGTAVFMIGFIVLVVGWVLFSRANPPERV